METRKIFIDTQAFMQQGFKFEGSVLKRIMNLGRSSLIDIYVSEVVKREVTNKISEKISKATKLRFDLLKELTILESDLPKDIVDNFKAIDEMGIEEVGKSRWIKYLDESKSTIIDPNKICNQELLSMYFNGEFPFSEGKKKDEFPDAISILSLKALMEGSDVPVYVISNDKDLKGFCSKEELYISLSQLSEFLDLYNRAEERLTNVVHGYVSNEIDWITKNVKDSFVNCGFTYSENYEAEVDNVLITDLSLQEIDVVEIEDGRVIIEIRCEISYTADVSGPNYETAMWDNEDKEYMVFEYFNENMAFDDGYDISIELFFDESQEEFTEIDSIKFDGGRDIELHHDDGYPYK